MDIKDGYFYHIKNEFFNVVQDAALMSNKEGGKYRPHYFDHLHTSNGIPLELHGTTIIKEAAGDKIEAISLAKIIFEEK